jgi:DNA repair protein RadC
MKAKQKQNGVKSEDAAQYSTSHNHIEDDKTIALAIAIIERRMSKPEFFVTSPDTAADYLKLKLANLEHEVFAMLMLDNRHGVIAYSELFRGTIDGASVHPREVVKECLKHNAAAVVLAHNHPSGNSDPSVADQKITARLKDALALIEVRVLDHMVIGLDVTSFAEKGLI